MNKKIYNLLVLLFFAAVLILYGHGQSIKEYDKITNGYFNSTIYLETKEDQESSIKALKTIADEYDLTIAKIIPNHDNSTDIFVYSHDNKYIDEFLNLNGFVTVISHSDEIVQTFYNKDIFIKSLDELKNLGTDGKYALNIEAYFNLEDLTKKINEDYSNILTVYPNQNMKNTFTTSVDKLKYFYGIILIIILFATLITSFLYDIKSRKKEIAVKTLFGYGIKNIFYEIFMNKALRPIIVSMVISEIIAILFFIFNKNIKNVEIFKRFLIGSLKFAIIFAVVFTVLFSVFLLLNIAEKSRKLTIVSYIKGMESSGNVLSTLVKMSSTLLIIISFGLSVVSWNFVCDKMEAVSQWEGTKYYYLLNIYVPQYIYQNNKNQAEFEMKHKAIWSFLNEKKGIMFYKLTNKINQEPVFVNDREIDIPFTYINENYLRENLVVDETGNRITNIDEEDDNNSITILIPKQYKTYEKELGQIIHRRHVYDKYISEDIISERISEAENSEYLSKKNLDNPDIKEKFVYIKDNQQLFTYTAGGDFITDGVYALVNGENMGLNVYTPSLSIICVRAEDINELNKETRIFFRDLGYGEIDTDFSSVYSQNAEDIRYMKNIMMFSISVFIVSFAFLIFSLFFYLEVYFMNNKKGIAIKHFIGYGFLLRNSKAIISLLVRDVLIVVISIFFGIFAESIVVGVNIIMPILIVSLFVLLFDILCSVMFLKGRESKFMAETLKGE